jgi:hypothetical protein
MRFTRPGETRDFVAATRNSAVGLIFWTRRTLIS